MEFVDLQEQRRRISDDIEAGNKGVLDHGRFILGPEVAELQDQLANFAGVRHCISCANGTEALQIARYGQKRRYRHERLGVNSGRDSIQAAILLAKLRVLGNEVAMCSAVAARYDQQFGQPDSISTPYIEPYNVSAYAQFTLAVDDRDLVQKRLWDAGIPTAIGYPVPLNRRHAVSDYQATLPDGDKATGRVISGRCLRI